MRVHELKVTVTCLIMVNPIPDVPGDLHDYFDKYMNENENILDNPLKSLNIDSQYYDIDQLNHNFHNNRNKDSSFEYCSMHLNIQSLPAKYDQLKLLISNLNDQHIY